MILTIASSLSLSLRSQAQPIQRQWIKTYSLHPTQTNRASHITLTLDGNIIVAGTSHNGANNADYFAIKYNPAGETLWTFRFDNAESTNDILTAITLDPAGNLFLTGTSETIKINPAGQLVWDSPFPARSIVANAEYVYITGAVAGDISTTQLENNDTNGRDRWTQVFSGLGLFQDRGDLIVIDSQEQILVTGEEAITQGSPTTEKWSCFIFLKYSPDGHELWRRRTQQVQGGVEARSLKVFGDGSFSISGQRGINATLFKCANDGTVTWGYGWPSSASGQKFAYDPHSGSYDLTSSTIAHSSVSREVVLARVNADGKEQWLRSYPGPGFGKSEGMDVAHDRNGHIYVCGYSPRLLTENDCVVIKYDRNGSVYAADRYNSPRNGSDFGRAMVVDTNGNVYVTGYSIFLGAESEFLTIKYSAAPKIETSANGAIALQFHSVPNRPYSIETTTNFQTWTSLVTNIADINGIIRFEDTNAATIPYRFYRGNSAP